MSFPLPTGLRLIERGWLNANHVVIDASNGPILIDTGHSRDQAATVRILRQNGVDPESLSLIANTHAHPDHWGGNRALVDLSGAPIACGEKTASIFARNDHRAMWIEYFGSGVYHDPSIAPLPADHVWRSGELVQLGPFPFEVLDAPGHAPDSIALWQPEHGILISADALHDGDCGILHVAVHGQGIVQQAIDTVHCFRSLEPRLAIPGHGPLIRDVPRALDRLEQRLISFQQDPAKLARHLCGRVLMSSILAVQPIALDDLCRLADQARWFDDYGPMLGIDHGTALVHKVVHELKERGSLQERDKRLWTPIRR